MSQIQTFDHTRQRSPVPAHLEEVVNAATVTVYFEIDSHPGSPTTPFTLQPGERAILPKAFCRPIEGANPARPRESILHMKTAMSPYADAPQIQTVVPVAERDRARAAWLDAQSREPKSSTVVLTDTKGKPVPIEVPRLFSAVGADDDLDAMLAAGAPRTVSLAERERIIAERERDLADRERAIAARESTASAEPEPTAAAAPPEDAPPAIKTVTAPVPEQPKPKARG